MALSKEDQKKLLKALKFSDDVIAKVDTDTDEAIELPTLHIYDAPGLTELETNIRKGYVKQGDAEEIWCRQMNTEHELGLTGAAAKDKKKVIEAMKAKAVKEAGITPTEWADKFKTLQESVTAKDGEVLTVKQQLDALQAEKKYRKLFFADMNDSLDDDEWIARLQKNFTIKMDDNIEGLWDNSKGKFISDDKANTLPYKEAFEKVRGEDRFKSWYKAKATEPAAPAKKVTHDPANRNPALAKVKKYNTAEEIMKEVDKQYPPEKKQTIPMFLKVRKDLFNKLRAESA